jgi:N-acetylgalactosamine PTS system EIIA component
MTSNPGPRAVLAGHGDFAAGLASAVAQISGRDDVFALVTNRGRSGDEIERATNRGRSGDEIERALREALDTLDAHVVFTDLPAGSCTFAARRLQRERPGLVLVTGANLATLLDFVFAVGDEGEDAGATAARSAAHAVDKGRASLTIVSPPPGAAGGARGAA